MTSPWRPLLQPGDLAARVERTVDEIAAALDDVVPDDSMGAGRGASLASGAGGQALFHAYLALHGENEKQTDRAADLLDTAVEALATTVLPPALWTGFAGVAWTVEHLQGRLFEEEEETGADSDPNGEIDDALLTFLRTRTDAVDYDLIGGFTGLGVYACERLSRPSGAAVLAAVVARLAAQAETGSEGAAWFTPPARLPEHQREINPGGLYNLGVAHGMPAVVALLGKACAAGVAVETARPLLDGAVRWLLAHRLPGGSPSCFDSVYVPGKDATPSRLAWCYGDPGIAATLLVAARAAGEAAWEREAVAIGRSAATRPPADAGVRDGGLCHGAAGLAHLFNRLWQTTDDETFATAARFWIEQTLDLRVPGEGIAGYRVWRGADAGGWSVETGFLEGAAGIGLALLAAVSPVEPAWDRALLLS